MYFLGRRLSCAVTLFRSSIKQTHRHNSLTIMHVCFRGGVLSHSLKKNLYYLVFFFNFVVFSKSFLKTLPSYFITFGHSTHSFLVFHFNHLKFLYAVRFNSTSHSYSDDTFYADFCIAKLISINCIQKTLLLHPIKNVWSG